MNIKIAIGLALFLSALLPNFHCISPKKAQLDLRAKSRIAMIGGNLGSRDLIFGSFETEMHLRYPDSSLYIRNMCDGGDTPGFRPHSARFHPWAFPGAEKYQDEYGRVSDSDGCFEEPDEWLQRLKIDMIFAFFGYSESFKGPEGIEQFKAELQAFIDYTKKQQYNKNSAPQLALVSPIAFEDLSKEKDLPNGDSENKNLILYTQWIKEIAEKNNVAFVDLFHPSLKWYKSKGPLTRDGFQLNQEGYDIMAKYLADHLFGKVNNIDEANREELRAAVNEKNWFWHNDYKVPNGVHVYGRRYNPFGPDNYPAEIQKIREMTAIRDTAIWNTAKGLPSNISASDAQTILLPEVKSNYSGGYGHGLARYLNGEEALKSIHMAPGFKIELFASEQEFPDLANPVQLSFDNEGRLWVATMPSYPHYRPGDERPNDKLIILEDTDNDGKADKQTIFADGLHLPVGFEFAPEGVYVSQGTNLKLLTDTDGDDRADKVEVILSGFDDHDTHHVISAFCADPSGAIYMAEGVFLHTNVETPYGTVRGTNGGFYRYAPQNQYLERTAQIPIPNPWGIAFDDWGQPIFAETSGPAVRWMLPSTIKSRYGTSSPRSPDLIEEAHKVRPTSGLEFISSRHFPDEFQGDFLINNSIGFLGTKQHSLTNEGTGFKSKHRLDLLASDDPNFRPVDMEFAPDGSLYLVDWHNILIGHMQHNARDPMRDHVHGRIYRITYPSRALVEPAKVSGATIPELLDNLKLPEYRTRYRSRRELRERDHGEVAKAITKWTSSLDPSSPGYEHQMLEALWVSWGINKVDQSLLKALLKAKDFRARAAAVRAIRYNIRKIPDYMDLLKQAAIDEHGRVRLEAIVVASWLEKEKGLAILKEAKKAALDDWMIDIYKAAFSHLNGVSWEQQEALSVPENLSTEEKQKYIAGREIYSREGYCGTCHQDNGKGLYASGFPPLAASKWVLDDDQRLIKLTLKGLFGPIEVLGKKFEGLVPMTPYEGLLNDQEIADVLSYVRRSFGNRAPMISSDQVAKVRAEISDKKGFYSPEELLKQHPHKIQ